VISIYDADVNRWSNTAPWRLLAASLLGKSPRHHDYTGVTLTALSRLAMLTYREEVPEAG
jgi:hypothetical protein